MSHTRNNIWNRNLPRALGLFVLVLSLSTIFWLSRNVVLFGTKAAVSNVPRSVQVSNITSNSFTVSYLTDDATNGSITYGKDSKLGIVSFDVRDNGTPTPHRLHYITAANLSPSTNYFFSIVSGDAIFQNNSTPYQITTAPTKTASPSATIQITGEATEEAGKAPTEALTYIDANGSQLLSTLLKPDGSYSIDVGSILKKDLSAPFNITPETLMHMHIINELTGSNISFLLAHANPLPLITLSKDYDFSIASQPISSPNSTESAQVTGFPISEDNTASSSPQILTPKIDQEFKDQKPTFQGKALPDAQVEITIHSDEAITTTVQADQNGVWKFRPDTALSPGQHTLTVKTLDASGIVRTLTQSFTVFAEGSQFVEPSISPTPIPSPTVSLPTPTLPAPSPTISPSPTPSPTLPPTIALPSPTVASVSAVPTAQITTPPIPKSGSSAFALGAFGLSVVIGIGSLLFFLL